MVLMKKKHTVNTNNEITNTHRGTMVHNAGFNMEHYFRGM